MKAPRIASNPLLMLFDRYHEDNDDDTPRGRKNDHFYLFFSMAF